VRLILDRNNRPPGYTYIFLQRGMLQRGMSPKIRKMNNFITLVNPANVFMNSTGSLTCSTTSSAQTTSKPSWPSSRSVANRDSAVLGIYVGFGLRNGSREAWCVAMAVFSGDASRPVTVAPSLASDYSFNILLFYLSLSFFLFLLSLSLPSLSLSLSLFLSLLLSLSLFLSFSPFSLH
jgi:hypothetical protein